MDILKMLQNYGIDTSTIDTDEFNKEFRKSFKSDVELKKVQNKLVSLQDDFDTLKDEYNASEESISALSTVKESLEGELNTLKQVDEQKKEQSLFDDAFNGVEFTSDRVKRAIISEIKEKGFEEVDGKLQGVDVFLQDLYTEDRDLFKSVDSTLHTWSGGHEEDNKDTDSNNKDYSGLFGRLN